MTEQTYSILTRWPAAHLQTEIYADGQFYETESGFLTLTDDLFQRHLLEIRQPYSKTNGEERPQLQEMEEYLESFLLKNLIND